MYCNSMEQDSTWEATSFSASEEVFRILWVSLNFTTATCPFLYRHLSLSLPPPVLFSTATGPFHYRHRSFSLPPSVLSWTTSIQLTPSHPRIGLPSHILRLRFPTVPSLHLSSPIPSTYRAYFKLVDLVTQKAECLALSANRESLFWQFSPASS